MMRMKLLGAGIADLAVASGSRRAGVTVRGRRLDAIQNGSGLSSFTNAFTALSALDALELGGSVRVTVWPAAWST